MLKNSGFLLLHVVNSPIIESTLGKEELPMYNTSKSLQEMEA